MYLLEIKGIISKIILLKYGADKYMRKKSQKRDISEIINTLIIQMKILGQFYQSKENPY